MSGANGGRIIQAVQQQAQMEALIQAEIRQNQGRIFAAMVGPYLTWPADRPDMYPPPDPAIIRRMAALAVKAAPYLALAQGTVTSIDEEKHWAS